MAKKITKYDFNNDVKDYFKKTKKTIEGKNGKKYEITFTTKLSEKQKQEILQMYIDFTNVIKENGGDYDKNIVYLLILIRYLTDIYIYDENDKENANKSKYAEKSDSLYVLISKELDILNCLVELGLFSQIVENLNADAIKDLNEYLLKFTETSNKILDEYQSKIEEMKKNG